MKNGYMLHIKTIRRLSIVSALSLILSFNSSSIASDLDASVSVLRFQQKMAHKGHPEAQYKLAMMHESGTVVKIDIDQAKYWYKKAAYQDFKPAKNRLVYLDIRQNGFKKTHNFWLKDIEHDALYGDGEALFLLGQMYLYGTGLKQDLKKSVNILKRAAAYNIPASEAELNRAEKKYNEEKNKQAVNKQKEKLKQAKLIAIQEQKNRKSRKLSIAEKRRQIKQRMIEQQRRQFSKKYDSIEKQKQQTSNKTIVTQKVKAQ